MPLYEYICQSCGYHFEILRPMKEADKPAICTHCNSNETKRGVSTFFAQSEGSRSVGTRSCANCSGCSCGSCGH